MRRGLTTLLLAFFLGLAFSLQALYLSIDPPELWDSSSAVIIGKVTDSQVQEEGTGNIATYFTISLEKVFKGNISKYLLLRLPGGEINGFGLSVSDIPKLVKGERLLLFLGENPDHSFYILGGFQGKISLKNGNALEWNITEKELLQRLSLGSAGLVGLEYNPSATTSYGICKDSVTGNKIYWTSGAPTGGWTINDNDPSGLSSQQLQDAYNASANAWNQAGACFSFGSVTNIISDSSLTSKKQDGVNVLTFGVPESGAFATTYYWYYSSGQLIECDTVFDNTLTWAVPGCNNRSAYDLQNVATHEFGHWLCLNDLTSRLDILETMFLYGLPGGCQKQTLYSGDIAGIQAIYGACKKKD
ncbi:MAG: matrixin family metalloprotease [Chlamydiae bacterium]|nr:matrixin family metalloprotease [Chlamydiota bacterium]MBI3276961.1 matrixin family metalloprotease [Chlamydiota bacterium]